jgi:hypothetical protein
LCSEQQINPFLTGNHMFLNGKKIPIFSAIFLTVISFIFLLSPVLAAGDQMGPPTPSEAERTNYGLDASAKDTGLISKNVTPTAMAGTIVSAVLSLVGVIFFLLILYGGIRWMVAQGNETEVEKAKQIIVAAIIGLVIVLAAYAITAFIGEQLGLNK